MRTVNSYEDIVLAIAEGTENRVYQDIAENMRLTYFWGPEEDVLARTISCAESVCATDITRFTPESPYTCFESIEESWKLHVDGNFHASFLDNVPNGSNYEILNLEALKTSYNQGGDRHRITGPSLYIRENKDQFRIRYVPVDEELKRPDLRLTIDYPQDLILCREVYNFFQHKAPRIPVKDIIRFLDSRKDLIELVRPLVDEGLETMYL